MLCFTLCMDWYCLLLIRFLCYNILCFLCYQVQHEFTIFMTGECLVTVISLMWYVFDIILTSVSIAILNIIFLIIFLFFCFLFFFDCFHLYVSIFRLIWKKAFTDIIIIYLSTKIYSVKENYPSYNMTNRMRSIHMNLSVCFVSHVLSHHLL